ncbi:hypothetical protein RhiJN_24572 [Ceratobasidium sp. AG-Ba]|nr:hypothetical protein RhiJN_24572 [Ceratobasidium sp. AG-Ba]
MRAKQLFSRIPIPDKVKLVYARLTLNKLTTIYFVVAVIHCVLQVIFQLAAHAINVNARHLMSQILTQARLTMDKFALVETKRISSSSRRADLTLTLCTGIPGQFGLTGKDVCNVLWSQSKGLVKDTVSRVEIVNSLAMFRLLGTSDDEEESNSESDSDDDKTKTKSSQRPTPTSSLVATALPVIGFTSTSSTVTATSTSTTSRTLSSSSSLPRATTSSSTSASVSSSSASVSAPAFTISPAFPTPVGNLIQPDSPSSYSSNEDSPDSPSSDDEPLVPTRVKGRRARASANPVKREGERKVFDRERLRPLSLTPRPRAASHPQARGMADIDETHPNLKAHSRRAHVAPITSERLHRARAQDESTIEFVPIAPKRAYDPKKFVSSRSGKSVVVRMRRSVMDKRPKDITVTGMFAPKVDSDDEKKGASGAQKLAGADPAKERLVGVRVSGLTGTPANLAAANSSLAASGEVELTPGCALALAWPAQVLRDFEHEDLAMIGFQAWLLVMTIVAILNESVPHMVAGLFTQTLSTGWSAFQMARSSSFRAQYEATIVRGACAGVDVLPDYFSHRTTDEIPIVVLNGIFLVTMIGLSWKICRVYGWQTFKRIGASRVMNRAYQLVLAFSIHLQLAVFFFVTSSALWVDALLTGSIACFAEHRTIYEGIFITSVLLLLPWLILGWIGVRRENKIMMHVFLFISFLYITAWAAMFASDVYRWTFATWPFFAAMTVVSYVVLVATTGLAVVCRYNFKKGHLVAVKSQQILPGAEFSDVLPPADPEKVEFPTHRPGGELPTFSFAYGQGGQPVHPSQIAAPVPALGRNASARTAVSTRTVEQSNLPAGYTVNPFSTAGSHFWGDEGTKSNTDTSAHDTFRTAEASDADVPVYTLEPEPQTLRRELPQWEEVRRSELPPNFSYPRITTPAAPPPPPARLQYESHQYQADNSSVFTTSSTGKFEVLRDGQWVQVDARELHRASVGTQVSAGAASWAPADDRAPLPTRPPMPTIQIPHQVLPRGPVGLPGANIRPQKAGLGGQAVPSGW